MFNESTIITAEIGAPFNPKQIRCFCELDKGNSIIVNLTFPYLVLSKGQQ